MSLKLFFLTTEIEPFASTSHLGKFSVDIPLALQTVEHDIRTIIPKYGFVSERKYILREVIRLREIPFDFDGEEVLSSAKSAFIPKTRVQVYFLENPDYFKNLTNLLYKSKNGRILSDNDERYGYFRLLFENNFNFFHPIKPGDLDIRTLFQSERLGSDRSGGKPPGKAGYYQGDQQNCHIPGIRGHDY